MTTRLLRRAVCFLALLCSTSHRLSATDDRPDPSTSEQGLTFSHVYKIDIPGSSGCTLERLQSQDETGLQKDTTINGENDIVFKHNIRLQASKSDCEESESFKSLLYRVNGLEEEVNYLKTQCSHGCCGQGGAADTSCSGHGTYQQNTCSCLCNLGWEGPDCSVSSCPDECNDNGRCVGGRCVCHQGYMGEDCSQLMCPDNCNDKGQCVDGKCVCFPHFAGEDCSIPACPSDCGGSGRCVDGRCICDEGFYGDDCSSVFGPQDLRLVQATDISLLVEWDAVRGAEYYVLTYHPKFDEGAMETISNTENSYLITGLTPGVTYVVQVYAVIKSFRSDADVIEATTDVSAIDDIRVLGQTEVSIQVDWKNPRAEVDYFRLRHTDPSGQEEEMIVQRSQEARTKHTIVGLYPGTEYQISVQAIQGNTEGKASVATGVTDIDTPTNLVTTEVTEDMARVSWERVQAEIDGYMLSYSSAGGSSPEIPVGRDRTSYKLVGLRPGVVHTVYIWAFRGDRASGKSSTEADTELDAPTNLLVQDETESSFRVRWDPTQAEIDGYMMTYSSSEGMSEEIPLGSDSVSHVLSGLRPGLLYTIDVWAIKGRKASKKTSTQAETELDAPANLFAQDETESSFRVTWDLVQADVDGYILTYSSPGGSNEDVSVGADSSSYTLTGLRPAVLYSVFIRAVKGSKASRTVSTQAETELDAPSNLLAQDETESSFRVSWVPVRAEIDGYILTYSSSAGSSGEIPIGPSATSHLLTSLRPGLLHTVYVWAVKGDKASVKISTKALTDIDPPKDLRASDVTTDAASLTWIPPLADIEGYILTYREEGGVETVERQLGGTENNFVASGLEMGKRYFVTVLAFRGYERSKAVETLFTTVGVLHPFPMDCAQTLQNDNKKSGVYTIYINNVRAKPVEVYCDMETDGGGWLVIQRRNTGKLDFMKRWRQYIAGFGNMTDEFWLGLEKIYELTNTPTQYELRFDLGLGSERVYAVYDSFKIAPVRQKFKLTIGKYRGTAGDAMTYHNNWPWTTVDSDNDIALGNCALTHRGAWWYKNCHLANLNGKWGDDRHSVGVNWEPWKGHLASLDFTEMKIRPTGATSSRKRRSLMAWEKSRSSNGSKK